jgi:hypothetical protein
VIQQGQDFTQRLADMLRGQMTDATLRQSLSKAPESNRAVALCLDDLTALRA